MASNRGKLPRGCFSVSCCTIEQKSGPCVPSRTLGGEAQPTVIPGTTPISRIDGGSSAGLRRCPLPHLLLMHTPASSTGLKRTTLPNRRGSLFGSRAHEDLSSPVRTSEEAFKVSAHD